MNRDLKSKRDAIDLTNEFFSNCFEDNIFEFDLLFVPPECRCFKTLKRVDIIAFDLSDCYGRTNVRNSAKLKFFKSFKLCRRIRARLLSRPRGPRIRAPATGDHQR